MPIITSAAELGGGIEREVVYTTAEQDDPEEVKNDKENKTESDD